MITEKFEGSNKDYWNVLADGKFHKSVPEGTEGAVIRHYEDKDTKEDKVKHELVADSITGKITKIELDDTGSYGEVIRVELDGEGVLSFGCSSNFGEDLMKKIPAIKRDVDVKLTPYSFTEGKKTRKGVTVEQNGEKIQSVYWDGKKAVGGIPEPEGDTKKYKSDDWKIYFMQVRKFLIGRLENEGLATRYVKENNLKDF